MPLALRTITTCLVVFLAATGAWAASGTISGIVTDSTGAVIANAQVTLTEVNTGVAQTIKTNDEGVYSFLSLPVGTYKLETKMDGFQEFVRTGIALNTDDRLRFDILLNVGKVAERIEVTTSPVNVEVANTQLGDVIKSTSMLAMPLNGRSFTDLMGLQPGVMPTLSSGQTNAFMSGSGGNLSVSGQREGGNIFMVNGANTNNALNNGISANPNLDSIDEFRVLTADFDAEHGNFYGGVVTVVTKSGTNQFHGDVFEFLRNEKLDARNFFSYDKQDPITKQYIPGTARGVLKRNQFGGVLGGPIKRDKAFFFVDYEGARQVRSSMSGLVTVPTALERSGDFSATASKMTGSVIGPYWAQVLTQRLGYPVKSGERYYTAGCTNNATCVFPNAVIPSSAFSAPSKSLLPLIETANVGPYYVTSSNKTESPGDGGSGRLDLYSKTWGTISGYYFFSRSRSMSAFGGMSFAGYPSEDSGQNQLWKISDTKTFSATSLNEFHMNWNRVIGHNGIPVGDQRSKLSSYGFAPNNMPGGFPLGDYTVEGLPRISITGCCSFGVSLTVYNRYIDTPSISDNFSKVAGRHTLKFGGQYMFTNFYEPMPQVMSNGRMSFNGSETGIAFADYLIGASSGGAWDSGFNIRNRRNYAGFFGQDSWRVRSDFTLNFGLRWDIIQGWYESRLQSSTFAYGVKSTVYPDAPVGVVFPGDTIPGFGKIPSTLQKTPNNNIAPRFGFAYSPSPGNDFLRKLTGGPGKFSIRGGYGLFYGNVEGVLMLDESGQAPFAVYYSTPVPMLFDAPLTDRADGNKRRSPFPFVPQAGVPFDWASNIPMTGFVAPEWDARTPYSESYNLTLQRQFGTKTLVTLGYVGTQAHHLPGVMPLNPGNPALCLSLSQPSQVASGTPTCGPSRESSTYTRPDGSKVIGTRVGPWDPTVIDDIRRVHTVANSNYNALQTSLHFNTQRLTFFASYTYSKAMDDTSALLGRPINPLNARISRALSTYDMTHNFVLSYQYTLPFDVMFGKRLPRLTSGWKLVGITRFATGLPLGMTETDDRSLLGTSGIDTPKWLGGDLNFQDPRTGLPYFNTALFAKEDLGVLGNAPAYFFHGPGTNNWDMALHKEIRLTESKTLMFRAEFFNAFNHAQFGMPSGNINSSSFGKVTSAGSPRIGQLGLKLYF